MRVPLIISPSRQPLAKAQYPCKPPNPEVRRLPIVRVHMLSFFVF